MSESIYVPRGSITVTAACDPRASATRARTKAGALRKPARKWRNGLAWSTKLTALETRARLAPPYVVTVHSFLKLHEVGTLDAPADWFEGIAEAVGEGLSVSPRELQLTTGRAGYAPPYAPSHFKIVVTAVAPTQDGDRDVTCRACGVDWRLGPDGDAPDQCPHCGHEGGGVPYLLGLD